MNSLNFTSIGFGIIVGIAYAIYVGGAENPRKIFKNVAGGVSAMFLIHISKGTLITTLPKIFTTDYFVQCNLFIWAVILSFSLVYSLALLVSFLKDSKAVKGGARLQSFNFFEILFLGLPKFREKMEQARILASKNPLEISEKNQHSDKTRFSGREYPRPQIDADVETTRKIQQYIKNIIQSKLDDKVIHSGNLLGDNMSSAYKQARQKQLEQHLLRIGELETIFEAGTAKVLVRTYEEYSHSMILYPNRPGNSISLGNCNLIQVSLDDNMNPVLYSQIPDGYVFDQHNELINKRYDDCLVLCLAKKGNIPILSLEIFIKDLRAAQLLKYMIKLGVIQEIALAICHKVDKIGKEVDRNFIGLQYCVVMED